MKILVPIDGSDCSFRALEFAADLAKRYGGAVHVVHVTDHRGAETDQILDRAAGILADAGLEDDPEVVTNLRMAEPRYATQVGKEVIRVAEEGDYDHVVMGHHGAGRVGRLILGSAAETVVRAATVPCTVIP